jgi:predicted small metal-binding protein
LSELTIACACGWSTSGSEDAVVEATKDHGKKLHNMDVTRAQALAMASPAAD